METLYTVRLHPIPDGGGLNLTPPPVVYFI